MSNIPSFSYGQTFVTPILPKTSFVGKTVVITGANTGLGYEAALHFLRLGVSHLVLGCRDLEKGEAAKAGLCAALNESKKSKIEVWQVDLCDYGSVISFADRCTQSLPRIDAFLDNAGMYTVKLFLAEETERTLTVNVFSTFLLAILLLPKLRHSAEEFGITPHIVITGSVIHLFAQDDQLTTPAKGQIFKTLSNEKVATPRMVNRYFLSKLICHQLVRELAMRANTPLSKNGKNKPFVVVNCPNPGWCQSNLHRDVPLRFPANLFFKLIGRTGEVGARTLVHAAIAGKESNGQYLSECVVKPPSPFVRSEKGAKVQKDLWEELMAILEVISPGVTDLV